MGVQNTIDLNYWITRGMARRMGVNLTESMKNGFLTQADFSEMITSCRTCGGTEICLSVLSEGMGAPNGPPAHCPNLAILNGLRDLH